MDAEVDYEPEEQPAVGAPAGGGHVRGNAGGGVGGGTSVDPTKGRGRLRGGEDDGRYAGKSGVFESIDADGSTGPAKSIEGWVIFVTGVHEEASEDDVLDLFAEFGPVRSINFNLDRQTGYAKGYALIEYATRAEADAAISGMNGQALLGKEVHVSFAFVAGNRDEPRSAAGGRASSGGGGRRQRGGGSSGGGRRD